MNSLNNLSMFLKVVQNSFASDNPIDQKLTSFDKNKLRISNLIKSIEHPALHTAWDTFDKNVTALKAGPREDTAADMEIVKASLSDVAATVKALQGKALEKVATPVETKKVDYELFLDTGALSTMREAYALKSLFASLTWPNTCEAFSQLVAHVLRGDYGSEIRERLVEDSFEQGQMLLLLLVDQLQNKGDFASIEIFQKISKDEVVCLAAVADELKKEIVPYLTSKEEVALPEQKLLMSLLARIRIKDEGEFKNLIEYYRALYNPTIGQLLHLATSSKTPDFIESLQSTTLSEQKLALFTKALDVVNCPDSEKTKLLLELFVGPQDSGFVERRAIAKELLAVMANKRPQLALELANSTFTTDEIELAYVTAGILSHAAKQDVDAALKLVPLIRLKSRALGKAAIAIAKSHPRQAIQLIAQMDDLEHLEKSLRDIIDTLSNTSFLGEDLIEELLNCAERLLPGGKAAIRMQMAWLCFRKQLPQLAWKIANFTEGRGLENYRITLMCLILREVDIQEAVKLHADARYKDNAHGQRLENILHQVFFKQMKNLPIEDIVAMYQEIPDAYDKLFLTCAAYAPFVDVSVIDDRVVETFRDRWQKLWERKPSFEEALSKLLAKNSFLDLPLQEVRIHSCQLTRQLIDSFKKYGSTLHHLELDGVNLPAGEVSGFAEIISGMPNLESLTIRKSNFNEALDLSAMPQLRKLDLSQCTLLSHTPDLTEARALEELNLSHCHGLPLAPVIPQGSRLTCLHLEETPIISLDITHAMQLKELHLDGCAYLSKPPVIPQGGQLEVLSLAQTGISDPPDLTYAMQLKKLDLSECGALTQAPVIPEGNQLETASLSYCPALLPPFNFMNALQLKRLEVEYFTPTQMASIEVPQGVEVIN